MRTATLLTAACVLLVPFVLPTTQAGNCSAESPWWDYSWSYPSCSFSCSVGDWLQFTGSVNNNGYVGVDASCGGTSGQCSSDSQATPGYCDGASFEPASSSSSGGSCEGSGYGSAAHTDVYVYCYTNPSGETALLSILEKYISCGGSCLSPAASVAPLPALPPAASAMAFRVVDGVAVGMECHAGRCVAAPVACVEDLAGWTCGVKA